MYAAAISADQDMSVASLNRARSDSFARLTQRDGSAFWAFRLGGRQCDALDQVHRRQRDHLLGVGLDGVEPVLGEHAKRVDKDLILGVIDDGVVGFSRSLEVAKCSGQR